MLYRELVELYEKLGSTSKRLKKTHYISELIKRTKDDLPQIMLMVQGKLYPDWEETKIGVASKLVVKAINKATGISEKEIENEWKKLGDLGDVAESLIKKRKQASLFPKKLTINQVLNNLRNLASYEGKGSVENKLNLISDLLINAGPNEAKYIVRTVLDKLRVGIGSGTVRDALVWAHSEYGYNQATKEIEITDRDEYNKLVEKIQQAYDLSNDWGKVALLFRKGNLDDISIEVGKPINVMQFQKAKDIEDAFSIVGKPAAFEFKYDGFRMQIHIGDKVQIFTRRLEDVTKQFPEVVKFLKNVKAKTCILDAEAVGYDPKTKKYLPFQKISQRIKRKYDIESVAEEFPVEVNVFDIIYYNGKSLLNSPFMERRKLLDKIINQEEFKIVLAKQIITDNETKAQNFINQSYKAGEEGAMAKNLSAIYKPGSRVGYGVKLKSVMEPLDLVIIAAEYGEGKRSGWLSSFYLACSDNGELKEIGKVSTGLKELEEEGTTFEELTKLLKPLITKFSGKLVEVKPEIVVEVGYEEIQKSTTYSSGFALRFPRFLRLRTMEKKVKDINTIEDVKLFYEKQRGRNL